MFIIPCPKHIIDNTLLGITEYMIKSYFVYMTLNLVVWSSFPYVFVVFIMGEVLWKLAKDEVKFSINKPWGLQGHYKQVFIKKSVIHQAFFVNIIH